MMTERLLVKAKVFKTHAEQTPGETKHFNMVRF